MASKSYGRSDYFKCYILCLSLSVSTGIILIYKFIPEILKFEFCSNLLLVIGILTVIYSSIVSRVQTDAKSSLGYASSVQIGFVLIELSLGYTNLALCHLFLNSFYKLYQFIKSPSLLTAYYTMVGENRTPFKKTGIHFEYIMPMIVRKKLYYFSLNEFYLDSFYNILRKNISRLSIIAEQFFYPLINKTKKHTYKTMLWWLYYVLVVYFISLGAFEINSRYFDFIPFIILLVSFSVMFEKNENSFIAMLMIYKILESFIVHGVHSHEPFKWLAIFILGFFIYLIIKFELNNFKLKNGKKITEILLVFLMLYFTNFPFLLQSLINEHIIVAFLEKNKVFSLTLYCLANTFLNIGLYNFIFNKIYINKAIDG